MCYHISRKVETKYPLKKYTAVGAFIFLRFFSPAIASPDSENLCKPIDNQRVRRALMSVTRVIQTIANNGVRKESHMSDLNDFIVENVAKMNAYLERISVCLNHSKEFDNFSIYIYIYIYIYFFQQ